jgi:ribose transport system permease protein
MANETNGGNNIAKKVLQTISNFREINLIVIILALSVILSITTPSFLKPLNLRSVSMGFATNVIVVIGMALVIICGGIDLSVGSVLCLSCSLTTVLFKAGCPFFLASAAGLGISILCGVFNGVLIAYYDMAPFIVTMSMMQIARGLGYILTTGTSIALVNQLPPAFRFIGAGILGNLVPFLVVLCVLIGIIADVIFRKTPLLRTVYYVGSNSKAAAFSGINVKKVKVSAYIASALLAGIGGQMTLSRFNYSSPTFGNGLEMTMIAGCVIGGVSMEGGEGTVLGSMLGVVLLSIISNGLILLDVSVYWQQFITGLILITAVSLDYFRVRRQASRVKKIA